MVWASFAADSLALGAHWVYDTGRIDQQFGRVSDLLDPRPPTYHPTKKRGDFTHYGDQALLLLQSLAEHGGFDDERFGRQWQAFFQTYPGYVDGATRQTLKNLGAGEKPDQAGSTSDDLAGAARIAPLVYRYRQEEERLVDSARRQTRLTHNRPEVIDSAEFFARVALRVLQGSAPAAALVLVRNGYFRRAPLGGWIDAGIASTGEDTRAAIQRFGQMCEAPAALPATVHLIARYEGRLEEGLIENVMAGGDSAGRGMIAGMILGAHASSGGVPDRWRSGLQAREKIEAALALLDAAVPAV
jgi:ADP-ribosylglycohydrolase